MSVMRQHTYSNDASELPSLTYQVPQEFPPYSTQTMDNYTKLFIHNIDFRTTRATVLKVFAQFGRIKNVNFVVDQRGNPRGLVFISYFHHEDAVLAISESQKGIQIGQRNLRVEIYKPLYLLQKQHKGKHKEISERDEKEEGELETDTADINRKQIHNKSPETKQQKNKLVLDDAPRQQQKRERSRSRDVAGLKEDSTDDELQITNDFQNVPPIPQFTKHIQPKPPSILELTQVLLGEKEIKEDWYPQNP